MWRCVCGGDGGGEDCVLNKFYSGIIYIKSNSLILCTQFFKFGKYAHTKMNTATGKTQIISITPPSPLLLLPGKPQAPSASGRSAAFPHCHWVWTFLDFRMNGVTQYTDSSVAGFFSPLSIIFLRFNHTVACTGSLFTSDWFLTAGFQGWQPAPQTAPALAALQGRAGTGHREAKWAPDKL